MLCCDLIILDCFKFRNEIILLIAHHFNSSHYFLANGSAPGLLYTTENQLCHMDIPMSRSTVRAALDTEACVNVSQPGEQSLDAFHMDFMPSHHVLERNYNTLYDINDKRFQYVGPDGVVPDPDSKYDTLDTKVNVIIVNHFVELPAYCGVT